MQTFDQSLWDLFQAGLVKLRDRSRGGASNADEFKLRMQGYCVDGGHLAAVDAVGPGFGR